MESKYKNQNFVNELQQELVGKVMNHAILIRTNNENLTKNGEMCFPANLIAWRGLIQEEDIAKKSANIFEHYMRRKKCKIEGLTNEDIFLKATQCLILASESWRMRIERCSLKNDRVSLFLNRKEIIESVIKETLRVGVDYGKMKSVRKKICLRIEEDKDSDLTTVRLRLVKEVSERTLRLKGYEIVEEDADFLYLLTTKSQQLLDDLHRRIVCGVAMNKDTNSKETQLDFRSWIDRKIEELKQLNVEKILQGVENQDLQNIAQAIVTFELLSVKPSRPVFVGISNDSRNGIANSKGGSFVLYNTARISAILERFEEEVYLGNYPSLTDINNVDFSQLNQEEEWELVYNFILAYPEIIDETVKTEPFFDICPHIVCLFLSRLSQKFSVYYRRTRILTEGRDHLLPTMMARLHLLRALQIVLNNSLAILNIAPISHM